MRKASNKRYRVKHSAQQIANRVNPKEAVFRQGNRSWYAGDIYDGNNPAEPLRKGWLEEMGSAPAEEDEDNG